MKRETLRTLDDIVSAFGGDEAVASWLGIRPHAISMWRMRGQIPPGWHLRFWLASEELGYRIDRGLFGLHDVPSITDFRRAGRSRPDQHVA